ncbi:MAG TPA: YciI family protein [Kribbella sp.]|jgi:hypothetical protein
MRVMVLVKEGDDYEAGRMPSTEELEAMGRFNEELAKAGIMVAGEGLAPSSEGKRVRFDGDAPSVIDGPFTETKELVAGYWIWEVASLDEAAEWLKRAPFSDTEVEIRRIFGADDFGDAYTPEQRERDERLHQEISGR